MRGFLIGIGIAVALWSVAVIMLIALGRRSQARELATLIPNLLVLFRGLLRDPRVPRSAKLWLGVAVVWIASPIDLIPEFIPIAGPLDDAIVGESAAGPTRRRCAYDRLEGCRLAPPVLEGSIRVWHRPSSNAALVLRHLLRQTARSVL